MDELEYWKARAEQAEQAQAALALQVAREWQEVISVLGIDAAQQLEIITDLTLKEPGHPYVWGKISILRTLTPMADADVERYQRGAPLLAVLAAARAYRDAVQRGDKPVETEQALLAAVEGMDTNTGVGQ